MEKVLEYVQNFLTLFLLIKILLFLVPKHTFSKYIAFFSGAILVIGMLQPIMQLFGSEEALLEKLEYEVFEEKLLELSLNADYLQENQMDAYRKNIENVIRTEVDGYVEEAGYETKDLDVVLTKDYEIECLSLTVTEQEEEIKIEEIEIGEEADCENKEEEYQMLKEKIAGYYKLSEEQFYLLYE